MNCADLRDRLPELAYDALAPEEQTQMTDHLRDCLHCRRELEELRQVRGLLDAAPVPVVRVDAAAVYRAAAAAEKRRFRRWRRLALAAGAVAAALLLVLLGRLEVRLEAHQFVLRWQAPPAPETPAAPAPQTPAAAASSPTHPDPREWQDVNVLLQALVEDARMRDVQHQQDMTRLRAQIEELRRQNVRRLTAAAQQESAHFIAQIPTRKGANP